MKNIKLLKCPIFDKQVDVSGKQPGQLVNCPNCESTCEIVLSAFPWYAISPSGKTTQTPPHYKLVQKKNSEK